MSFNQSPITDAMLEWIRQRRHIAPSKELGEDFFATFPEMNKNLTFSNALALDHEHNGMTGACFWSQAYGFPKTGDILTYSGGEDDSARVRAKVLNGGIFTVKVQVIEIINDSVDRDLTDQTHYDYQSDNLAVLRSSPIDLYCDQIDDTYDL